MRSILTINAGSSSIKFALFECSEMPAESPRDLLRRRFRGAIERIGLPNAELHLHADDAVGQDEAARPVNVPDHDAAVTELLRSLDTQPQFGQLSAIAHRIVHGGPRYSAPVVIDDAVLAQLRALSPYDPDHLPQEIALAETLRRRFPGLPQVACFDTAFHHDMPRVAQLLPLPRRFAGRGLRRYGFHGLSYAFLMQQLERLAGAQVARGRVVLAHLGNGASLAAVRNRCPVDTSMAFTPASGVVMSTRSGDLDPGLVWYLARSEGLDARAFNRLVNAESGLLGVSETSGDMRDLLAREETDERARDAVDLFCYQVRKCIGAYSAVLGGLDTLVFAGGIGERAAPVRARICSGLEFLGVRLDPELNARHAPEISAGDSRASVRVIPTDEEQMMAQLVRAALWSRSSPG